jgi:hypothetical protein
MEEFSFRSIIKSTSSAWNARFDYEKARNHLEIPDNFDVMAMSAIGKKGPKNNLPPQLQEREYPIDRKPLAEIVMEGQFKKYSGW